MALLSTLGSMVIPTIVGNVVGRAIGGKTGARLGSLAGSIYGGRNFLLDAMKGPNPIIPPDTAINAANQVAPNILGTPTLNQSLLGAPQVNGILTGTGNTPLTFMDKATQAINQFTGPISDTAANYPTMTNMGAQMAAMSMLQPRQQPPVIASGMEGATITPKQGNVSGRVPGLRTDPVRIKYSPNSLYPVSSQGMGGRQMFYY
jgi:hypothetical protein